MKKLGLFIILTSVLVFDLKANDTRYAASFLELGVGARALGMGGAAVALSSDATAFYWNPAGLAFLPHFQAASMYASLFNSLERQNYLSAALPIMGGGAISFGWIRVGVDDIPRYLYEENDKINAFQRIHGYELPLTAAPTGYFNSYDDAFFISFARFIPRKMDLGWQYFDVPVDIGLGLNLKLIRQSLDNKSASGVGVDLGAIVRLSMDEIFDDPFYGDLIFGLNVQDVANTQITWNTDSKHSDRIHRNFKYGLSYLQPLSFIGSKLSVALDIDSRYEGFVHFGGEYVYQSMLALRLGSNNGYFTTGAGIAVWKLQFDYAYQSHDLGNSHRVSIMFGF